MPKTFLKMSRTRSPSSIWARGSLRKRCLGVGERQGVQITRRCSVRTNAGSLHGVDEGNRSFVRNAERLPKNFFLSLAPHLKHRGITR